MVAQTQDAQPPEAPLPANRAHEAPGEEKAPPTVDERRIESHGVRQISGERLTLYTDLPPSDDISRLPDIFALALPQWCRYFNVDDDELASWHVRGCLMNDRQRFLASGLLPADLEFSNAYAQDNCMWWQDQPTDYYRRHLMLHEATHAFMFHHFGDCGPGWFMEGVAELLGTHHLRDGRPTLGYLPASPEELPFWGRIELVRNAVKAEHALSITEVMAYQFDVELRNLAYAWCWAMAAFLDGHPRYRDRFRQLPGELKRRDLNRRFLMLFQNDWQLLNLEWQAFIHDLDYGYDLARNAIEPRPSEPLTKASQTITLAADRGWQASGIQVERGERYQLAATGRYQVASEPKVWWCEPPGVTIRYFRGRPLGMLLATIVPDDAQETTAWRRVAIGAAAELVAEASGTLYFRINDSPAELADNAGSLEVRVVRVPESRESRN